MVTPSYRTAVESLDDIVLPHPNKTKIIVIWMDGYDMGLAQEVKTNSPNELPKKYFALGFKKQSYASHSAMEFIRTTTEKKLEEKLVLLEDDYSIQWYQNAFAYYTNVQLAETQYWPEFISPFCHRPNFERKRELDVA